MPNANVLEAKKAIVAEMTEKLQNAASGAWVGHLYDSETLRRYPTAL